MTTNYLSPNVKRKTTSVNESTSRRTSYSPEMKNKRKTNIKSRFACYKRFPGTIFFRCTRMSAQMSAFSKEFLCLELSRFKIKNSSRNMISMNSIMVRTLAPMNNPIWPPMLAESKDKEDFTGYNYALT